MARASTSNNKSRTSVKRKTMCRKRQQSRRKTSRCTSNKTLVRRRTSRTLKGGKAFAKGSAGCTFRPALRCQNNAARPANHVTKLGLARNSKIESDFVKHTLRPALEFIRNPEPVSRCFRLLHPIL